MRISEIRKLGIFCPDNIHDDEWAWVFLETDCPQYSLYSPCGGPIARIEARLLPDGEALILETPLFADELENVFMGERVKVEKMSDGKLALLEVCKPPRFAHYTSEYFSRESLSHRLIRDLGGEWEYSLNMMIVHIPIEASADFERISGLRLERIG